MATVKLALTLTGLCCEEKLKNLQLTTQEERRERSDLATIYRASTEMEKVDKDDLFEWD